MDKTPLGQRLKNLREEKELKQSEIANTFGITVSQLSRYENGHTNPSPELIVEFASFYGVTTDYLLGKTNKNKLQSNNNWLVQQAVTKEEEQKLQEYLRFIRYERDKNN